MAPDIQTSIIPNPFHRRAKKLATYTPCLIITLAAECTSQDRFRRMTCLQMKADKAAHWYNVGLSDVEGT